MTLKTAIRRVGVDMAVGGDTLLGLDVLIDDRELGVDYFAARAQFTSTADIPSEYRHHWDRAERVFVAIQGGVPQRLRHVHPEVDV